MEAPAGTISRPAERPYGAAYWDEVLEKWEPTLAHRLWRAHSDAVNSQLLRRWLPDGNRKVLKTDLFDEAIGRGLYPALAASATEVHGIDVSPAAVGAARARYPRLAARVADVRALPFGHEDFDVIVSNSTLDHFASHAELRSAVSELRRVLQPGGKLIITLDNRLNPIVALRTSAVFASLRRAMSVPYFLGVTYGPRGLSRVLRASGFEVLDTVSVMHCPPRLTATLVAHRSATAGPDEGNYLRRVLRFEAMSGWPTAPLTGHFVCALAQPR